MIRAPIAKLASGPRTLSAETSAYLCRVLRLVEGDRFVAFDPEAHTEADATIAEASPNAARVSVGAVRAAAIVASTPLVLVYGLAKGEKVDDVVRDATELGATHIVLTATARTVVKVDDQKRAGKLERWRRIAEQAARQSRRADPPSIELAPTLAGALAGASALAEARFILDPDASEPLGRHLAPRRSTVFAVGAEGGFTDEEVAEARALGYRAVTVGSFVLRTETVAAAVLGALRVLEGT
jgi:16S rRNA (uracil1498-N3)-methyltransferase